MVKNINATNIVKYKNIHAGVNIHAGGFKNGFINESYQVISNIVILLSIFKVIKVVKLVNFLG